MVDTCIRKTHLSFTDYDKCHGQDNKARLKAILRIKKRSPSFRVGSFRLTLYEVYYQVKAIYGIDISLSSISVSICCKKTRSSSNRGRLRPFSKSSISLCKTSEE